MPPAYAGMIATRAEPGARQSTMVSVAHQIALAALAAERLYDVDRSSAKTDADVARFAAKVEIIADVRLDAYYPQHWPAEVDVEANGEIHQQRIVEAIGDPEHPLDQCRCLCQGAPRARSADRPRWHRRVVGNGRRGAR